MKNEADFDYWINLALVYKPKQAKRRKSKAFFGEGIYAASLFELNKKTISLSQRLTL